MNLKIVMFGFSRVYEGKKLDRNKLKSFFWKYRERNSIVFTMKKGYYFEKKLDL